MLLGNGIGDLPFICHPFWSPSWPALGCSCLICLPSRVISILVARSCLDLCPLLSPFWPAASPPFWPAASPPFWPSLGCSCLHLFFFHPPKLWVFLLPSDWVTNPRNHKRTPCLPSLSPFVVCLRLPAAAVLSSYFPPYFVFEPLSATDALCRKLVFFLTEPTTATLFPELSSSFLLGGCWQQSPFFRRSSLFFLYYPISFASISFPASTWCLPFIFWLLYEQQHGPFYSPRFAICVGWWCFFAFLPAYFFLNKLQAFFLWMSLPIFLYFFFLNEFQNIPPQGCSS